MRTIAARAYDRIRSNTDALNPRDELPFLLLLTACASTILLAGDIVRHNPGIGGLGWKEMALLIFSLALSGSAVALDLLMCQKRMLSRLRTRAGDLQSSGKFIGVALEVGLLVAVIREFRIGNTAFADVIAVLTFVGFCIHHLLPARYRL